MKDAMLEALEEIENGMCRIKERRSIWQNSLVYALCQAVRLLLIDKIKEKRRWGGKVMDAVKFIEESKRMCKGHEDWSAAHPRKTLQDVFLEQYPNAALDKDGVLRVCPAFVGGDKPEKYRCICLTDCDACRHEFWSQGVK